MPLAAFLTTGMSVVAIAASYLLRGVHRAEARLTLPWGLAAVALLIPAQLLVGHFTGDYVHHYQPPKFAAIEAEVGRQPWVVCGLLRTTDAVTPSLTTGDVITSLAYIAVIR
jgi:cytochrome d ubiquinol oxidase subunit I